MKRLFVGGPLDGKWEDHQDIPCVKAVENTHAGLEESIYQLSRFVSGDFESLVYFHEYIERRAMMETLIAGYRPKQQATTGELIELRRIAYETGNIVAYNNYTAQLGL